MTKQSQALPTGLFLLAAAWYPWSRSPGVDGKFLAMYLFGLLIVLTAGARFLSGGFALPRSRAIMLALLVFAAGALLSAIFSLNPLTIIGSSNQREGLLTSILYTAVFFVFFDAAPRLDPDRLGLAFAIAVGFALVIGFSPLEYKISEYYGGRFLGGFAEPSFLAAFLVMALPLCLYVGFYAKTDASRLVGLMASPAAGVALFLSGSRVGYLVFAAVGAAVIVLYFRGRRREAVTALFGWAACLSVISGLSGRFALTSLMDGFVSRINTWEPVMWTGRYLFSGPGPDRFRVISRDRFNALGPHNSYINYAANIGWMATLAYCALIVLVLVRLISRVRTEKSAAGFELWLAAAIMGYAFFGLGNYTRPYTTMIFWALLGLAAGISFPRRVFAAGPPAKGLAIAVSGLVASLLLITFVRYTGGAYYFWRYFNAPAGTSELGRWQDLSKAVAWEPSNSYYREIRAITGLEYLRMGRSDLPGVTNIRQDAVRDWQFLVDEVYNNRRAAVFLLEVKRRAGGL